MPAVLHRRIQALGGGRLFKSRLLVYNFEMPEISRFLRIVLTMFYNEHAPAHFHAVYDKSAVTISIRDEQVTGEFPVRQLRLVLEWTRVHKNELLENWRLAQQRKPLKPIAPMD